MSPQLIPNINFPQPFPALWATAFGEDEFGLWMELTVQDVSQRFRWLEAGAFKMGSTEYPNETPHDVTLSHGYWLADTACTQAMWLAVMGNNPAYFKEDINQPVERVSWEDVQEFLITLNQIPDVYARLPTEAEWEYACRAGTTSAFSFGDNITSEQVNYDGNYPYEGAEIGLFREKTIAVKSLPPNAWGLYEMHGNVWEWCADWYDEYPNKAVTDPAGAANSAARVLRGGSWLNCAKSTRSASRNFYWPVHRYNGIGFRLALGQTDQ
ncbi:MAG: formylglycine-generating enzyme family protein [Methylococcales bacterium]|nr:formylglycine-generating enzyme family protein [Methylococcales bacterium]